MRKIHFFLLTSGLLLFASCQKVVDIDLNSKDPQIVIEGNVSDMPGPYTVKVTQTVNFSQTNSFPGVTGAFITISDNVGTTDTLTETSPGIYMTNTLQGVPGRTYSLTVVTNGKTYTSTSTMPAAVPLDSIQLQLNTTFDTNYVLTPSYLDPAGQTNYYRCIETVNNVRVEGSFIFDDQFNDGLRNTRPLFDFSTELVSGDSVSVELQCIDQPVYLYFYSLAQTTNGQSAAPANPVSNISNKALGYFSAHASRTRVIRIP